MKIVSLNLRSVEKELSEKLLRFESFSQLHFNDSDSKHLVNDLVNFLK